MAFTSIPSAWIQAGKNVIKPLFEYIKNNFDDHESRISAFESAGNKIIIFNDMVDFSNAARSGDIRLSFRNGADYHKHARIKEALLMDGSGYSITGTDFAGYNANFSTLPDLKNYHLRGKTGVRVTGDIENDQNITHTHGCADSIDAYHDYNQDIPPVSGRNYYQPTQRRLGDDLSTIGGTYSLPGYGYDHRYYIATNRTVTDAQGGTEVRVKNRSVNYYLVGDDADYNYVKIFKAPFDMTIVSARASLLERGNSGTLQLDLLKGTSLSSLSSMLSSSYQMAQASYADYAQGPEASFSSTAVSQNDFIVLRLTSMQYGQSRFFFNCYAEPA
jgi:hypothetical protein